MAGVNPAADKPQWMQGNATLEWLPLNISTVAMVPSHLEK